MLFPYTYVPHQIEKMQVFIDFIFNEVWCKAPGNGVFHPDLFNGNPELKEVMVLFNYGDTKGGDFFYSHVERIYHLFAALDPIEIAELKQWYRANNNIEKICSNDPAVLITRYAEMEALHPELSKQLESFFKGLYSQDLLHLATLRQKVGNIDDHYKKFMEVNNTGKCPFCGISDIRGIHHTKRDAYDHYLPKALYPFNTINFHNLAPTCNECNSTYKLSKDSARNTSGRRKAFYPYAKSGQSIELKIDLAKSDIDKLDPADIQISFGPSVIKEEIETWKDVYDIEERYKAKCCSGDAKDWIEKVRILQDEYRIKPADYITSLQQQPKRDPFANNNFLERAFLEACNRRGLFTPTQ